MTPLPFAEPYPTTPAARDGWVLRQRGPKNVLDFSQAYAALWEEEPDASGTPISTATVFLTNRECPYRCLMCDLWRNTLDETVPRGAIAAQIQQALTGLPPARQIKLYNAGSFFDPRAIPPEDYAEIAETVSGFERVIVECHPRLVGDRTVRFRDLIAGQLEVAIGLETIHPAALDRLNKRFTVADFRDAAARLRRANVDLRVFLLVRPPGLTEAEGREWAGHSLDAAFDAGAGVCCVIPTRGGNGAMETLARQGDYAPPQMRSLEAVQEYGLATRRGRVFADLWDIEAFFTCSCSPRRAARLTAMNQTQRGASLPPPVVCEECAS